MSAKAYAAYARADEYLTGCIALNATDTAGAQLARDVMDLVGAADRARAADEINFAAREERFVREVRDLRTAIEPYVFKDQRAFAAYTASAMTVATAPMTCRDKA